MDKTVLALVGPTASGKTGLAIELAQHYPVEIISMDSALVYRDMDIGTAKPDVQTLRTVPHRLIDLIDPTERYSAARFRDDALQEIQNVHERGNIPLLVGGTMLYYKALVEGLDELPGADDSLRAEIALEAAEKGWGGMHDVLQQVDPAAAKRIEPSDAQRIQRALEVIRMTGKPLSSFWGEGASAGLPVNVHPLALIPAERTALHERIALRFEQMLRTGLVDELTSLKRKYELNAGLPSMRCVGYRQAWSYLEGVYDVAELRDRGIFATRQLAKRQLTWLRGMSLASVDCFDPALIRKVKSWADQVLNQGE